MPPGRAIPVWFGGFVDVAFRRAAQIGDGFIFGGAQADNLAALGKVRGYLEQAGRSPADFGIEAMLNYQSGPDNWRRAIEEWQAAGADYVSMRSMALRGMGAGLSSPRDHIEALGTYWKAVGDLAG